MPTRRPTYMRGAGKVHRDPGVLSFVSTAAENTSDPLDIGAMGNGASIFPDTATSITWYAREVDSGTFTLVQDAGTAGVQTVTASRWNKIPAAVMDHKFVKAVANTPGNCVIVGKG